MTEKTETLEVTMSAPVLGQMLKNGLASVSPDMARPILTMIRVELGTDTVRMVSTDSYTLECQELDHPCATVGSFLIHTATAKDWSKLLLSRNYARIDATVTVTDGTAVLVLPGVSLSVGVEYEGFPEYQRLIPEEGEWVHEPAEMDAVKLASMSKVIVPGSKGNGVIPWKCCSMATSKASVWMLIPNGRYGYRATWLQIPCRSK